MFNSGPVAQETVQENYPTAPQQLSLKSSTARLRQISLEDSSSSGNSAHKASAAHLKNSTTQLRQGHIAYDPG